MPSTVLERTSEQIAETVEKATRATTNIGDALHERLDDARKMAKRGAQTAGEFLDESKVHIKRHPAAAVTATFLLGLGIGSLLGWSLRRK
jgi:ElaB/YqjD/DUF883 family membrane-anchored ribosome-binding protein